MKNKLHIPYAVVIISFIISSCTHQPCNHNPGKVNFDHLKHLYEEITMPSGTGVGIVHIYSQYPDYTYEIEDDEGFTCVDDVARAVVLLSMKPEVKQDIELMGMMKKMLMFVIEMQADNGYFYNFLEKGPQINTTYRTSLPEPNWWSWRALWAMESSREFIKDDPDLLASLDSSSARLVRNITDTYLLHPYDQDTIEGIIVPAWLPLQCASDQAGLLIVALEKYYRHTQDPAIPLIIERFANGIMDMQIGDIDHYPYGAFLSWKNLWHAYGNIQAYALLVAGEMLENDRYRESAMQEINFFYSYLVNDYYMDHIWFYRDRDEYFEEKSSRFPQIAYGFRPMIFASLEAFKQTGDPYYFDLAETLAGWFGGDNIADVKMYDEKSGRCFDGINSASSVNMNSGAESTIEALLALQAIENARKSMPVEEE